MESIWEYIGEDLEEVEGALRATGLGEDDDEHGEEGIIIIQDPVGTMIEQSRLLEYERIQRRECAYAARVMRWWLVDQDFENTCTSFFWSQVLQKWPLCTDRGFSSKFGVNVDVFGRLWARYGNELWPRRVGPLEILYTFNWLTTNSTYDSLALDWNMPRSTFMSRVDTTLEVLYDVLDEINWKKCDWHTRDEPVAGPGHMLHNVTFILDGIECGLAKPVDRTDENAWYSHKKGGHSVKYEVAANLESGRIMWIAGGIPGALHDSTLTRASGLLDMIPEGELGIADAGYTGVDPRILHILKTQKVDEGPVQGASFTLDEWHYNRAMAAVRIEIERVNGRLKRFQVLVHSRTRERYSHLIMFTVLANFVNIWIELHPMRVYRHPVLEHCPFDRPERAIRH